MTPPPYDYRIIEPGDPLYQGILDLDRRIERALTPFRGHPGVERHFAIVEAIRRQVAAHPPQVPPPAGRGRLAPPTPLFDADAAHAAYQAAAHRLVALRESGADATAIARQDAAVDEAYRAWQGALGAFAAD